MELSLVSRLGLTMRVFTVGKAVDVVPFAHIAYARVVKYSMKERLSGEVFNERKTKFIVATQ